MINNVFTRIEVEYMASFLVHNSAALPDVQVEARNIGIRLRKFLDKSEQATRFVIVGFSMDEDKHDR